MFPMRMSSIFKSRWMALLWAAGIIWFAYDFAGSAAADQDGNQMSPAASDDANRVAQALGS